MINIRHKRVFGPVYAACPDVRPVIRMALPGLEVIYQLTD
jgi:hypothetical protein